MKRIIFSSFLAGTLLLSACSTDLDVIGDYKETMVVYGLLDQAQDTQYIKINKAFLGAGNAFEYAQIQDSVQFVNALSVELKRFKNGVYMPPTIPLIPTNKPKDPGVFYSANQANAIYSFSQADYPLFTDSEYQLTITNNDNGNVVTAKTSLITDISGFVTPTPVGTTFSFVIIGTYPNYPFNVKWTSAKNARLYQVILRLNYRDYLVSGDSADKSVEYALPVKKMEDLNGGDDVLQEMAGRSFYQYIGNTLTDYSGLQKRKAMNVDLLLIAGGDDLSTFMDVNEPSTGIIQERPEYTNITNGLGLFSARLNRAPVTRLLDNTSWDSLACGQFTKHLRFVNAVGTHPCF